MKKMRLWGKHAVGQHAFALVDDEVFDLLNQYHWKAKPNGGGKHIYAVRNTKLPSGKSVMLRMHRVVLGYFGVQDVDHIDRNTLNNQRSNLRVVSRSENLRNTAHRLGLGPRSAWPRKETTPPQRPALTCAHCGNLFEPSRSSARFCGEPCKKAAKWRRQKLLGVLPPSHTRIIQGTS